MTLAEWERENPAALVEWHDKGARVYRYLDTDVFKLYRLDDHIVISVVSGPGLVLVRKR